MSQDPPNDPLAEIAALVDGEADGIVSAVENAATLAEPGQGNWRHEAKREAKKGEKMIPDIASALAALRHAPELAPCFAFDEMQNCTILSEVLPYANDKAKDRASVPRPIAEPDITQTQEWMQRNGLPRIARETVYHAIEKYARERRFHPVRDYLRSLTWDRESRLDRWLTYYLGAAQTPYTAAIGRMFLIAMVARVMRPGCQADYMLVLEGEQGAGKSRACRILAGEWFSNNLPDVKDDKRTSQHLRGKWLVAIEELAGLSKAESEAIKAFLTRTEERYFPRFDRKEVHEPRQCVFIGTTNRATYLRDESGGRRFWPVKTGSIDTEALAHDRDQLFAEAVRLFDEGARWWPDAEFEREIIKPEQEERFEADAWENIIKIYLTDMARVTVSQVAREALFLDFGRIGMIEQRRIGAILQRLGWTLKRTNSARWYIPPAEGR